MKKLAKALPLLVLALGAGCMLVSGQITIVQSFDDDTGTSGQTIYALSVDLTENEDYEKHQDKIKSLEAIGFVMEITNSGNLQAKGQGYLAFDEIDTQNMAPGTLAARSDTYLILDVKDPIAPGETRNITFEDSQGYIANFDQIEKGIKEGVMYFYGITDIGQTVTYSDMKIIATVNFGL